jgi:hypothetical protein
MMSIVPRHLMGRTQNIFAIAATNLQLVLAPSVGIVAHRWSLTMGMMLIAFLYFVGFYAALRMTAAAAPPVSLEPAAELP